MFYIKPPPGQVSLHILENCVFARLEYLNLLYEAKGHEYNGNLEYLIEETVNDQIGHFILRLIASTASNLWNYWITREKLLFESRLNHISPRQLHRLFRYIVQQLRAHKDQQQLVYRTLINVCSFFLKPYIFKHLASKSHAKDCHLFHTRVRFELVPDIIKARKVDLVFGFAIIYCSEWKLMLASLFHTYVTVEASCMKLQAQSTVTHDARLYYIRQKIKDQIFQRFYKTDGVVMRNVDNEMKYFPPCMQHLHIKLRATHRLSHYARLYYSLFLKDSGMQLEDAISYWKTEYSKPHSCTSICAHSWQSNEQKFLYSIRHLYGLEGSRKNYRSPSCEFICTNVTGSLYEGGCPFKNFDENGLKNLLYISLPKDEAAKFIDVVSSLKPQTACTNFFKTIRKGSHDRDILIKSPVQYYLMMTNQEGSI